MSLPSLNAVFRALMTAVHQQFIHILILKAWNEPDMAHAVTVVDKSDFPVAMQLAHRIVALGGMPELHGPGDAYLPHLPAIGGSVPAIFAADAAVERRLGRALSAASVRLAAANDRDSLVLIGLAMRPRAQHLAWLQSMAVADPVPIRPPAPKAVDVVFAQLIAFIEQTFVHAFALWQCGAQAWADAAWASSGAAMVQADRIVTLLAGRGAVPRPSLVTDDLLDAPNPAEDPAAMLARDRIVAGRCRDLGNLAAHETDDADLAALLRDAAIYYGLLSEWRGDQPHPAIDRPAAFRSFGMMLERYVPAARPGARHAI